MDKQDIIQNLISRLGQSQDERLPPELGRHFADVDERSGEELLRQARQLASKLRFYPAGDPPTTETWLDYFPEGDDTALLARDDGEVPPHLALFVSFLRLYRFPQQAINTITGRHLDFQFRDVLRFVPRPARPDRAHVLLELKKGAAATAIGPAQSFSAGKDASGAERLYQPIREVVINHGKVAALHSVFRDETCLRFAPIANSADGLGGEFHAGRRQWKAFGHKELPPAPIGFAVASPVLRMQEGERSVTLALQLDKLASAGFDAAALAGALEALATGPEGWLRLDPLPAELVGDTLRLKARLSSAEPAIVDYDANVHGHAFATQAPVLQWLLKPDASLHYADLERLTLVKARLEVQVQATTALTLENDYGSLNPKKVFLPFGPQPVVGSRFIIGCPEALSKRLSELSVRLTWQGAPENLSERYKGYAKAEQIAHGVSADVSYRDRSGLIETAVVTILAQVPQGETLLELDALLPRTVVRKQETGSRQFASLPAGSSIWQVAGQRPARQRPAAVREAVSAPPARGGSFVVSLKEDFLHADYRTEMLAKTLRGEKEALQEPYTPSVQAISLSYAAQSDEVDIGAEEEASFTNPELQFFHVGCFGQMREHGYLRRQAGHLPGKAVSLLPAYPDEGEFLIGVTGVAAGDSLSLLMQVAEGSADPDLQPQPLTWSVLCGNYWRPLAPEELALDTSNALRTSGIVALALPQETTTEHTMLSAGLVWLRAAMRANTAAACQLVHVANNAVELRLAGQGQDPAVPAGTLEPGRITRLRPPLAAVKSVTQPFPSFGGQPPETEEMLTRRAAERLRHRQRCIAAWDYERLLLEAFPEVHKVKCIPHASESSWLAAGHVLLVVVPDLRNRNADDRLEPRVGVETLDRMTAFARQHCGMQVQVKVKNPAYQRIKLDFKVRFQRGLPFDFYRRELADALVQVLSPWAYGAAQAIEFGGQVFRSVLLHFVEKLPYVDFVTDFKLLCPASSMPHEDLAVVRAETPDAILVSDASHVIDEFPNA